MGARDLLQSLADAGVSVEADGGRLLIRPASRLTDAMREALRAAKPDLLSLLAQTPNTLEGFDLAAVAWTDGDIARFHVRHDRLARWGWPDEAAQALAARLVLRDRAHDDRVSCADCRHYRPSRCGNHRRAGLLSAELGRDLAGMLQRCPGFQSER